MFRRFGLVPIIAAVALAGCQREADRAADGNVAPADTNAVLAQGAATGDICGGIANIQCAAAGDFCQTPTGQCGPDAQGTCTTRPEICTREYQPVCGCDGRTYGNACVAASHGANVQAEGPCPGDTAEAVNEVAAD